MKNILTPLLLLCLSILFFSFTAGPKSTITGVYGVGESDMSNIKLTLNPDHTFTFTDHSAPENPVNANGTWEMKGKTVVLTDSGTAPSFHDKWRISGDGVIAKSRKGLCFYTLHKQI